MIETLLLVLGVVVLINCIVAVLTFLWVRKLKVNETENSVREELRTAREESSNQFRQLREEVANNQNKANEVLVGTIKAMGGEQRKMLDGFTASNRESGEATRVEIEKLVSRVEVSLKDIQTSNENRFEKIRKAVADQLTEMMELEGKKMGEVIDSINKLSESSRDDQQKARAILEEKFQLIQGGNERKLDQIRATLDEKLTGIAEQETKQLGEVVESLNKLSKSNSADQEKARVALEEKFRVIQDGNEKKLEQVRSTLDEKLNGMLEQEKQQLDGVVKALNELSKSNSADQEKARIALEEKFRLIQEGNEKKLEEMRKTVDEKLQSTLEKRLGESFKLVGEHLEAVQRGLGEMKNLATGVGDLKRVLTNVKERGTWGEYQLGAILEQVLTPDQYAQNVQPKGKGEIVEFAVKLPGKDEDGGTPVWLPIDAKFPKEDYERLIEASERVDADAVKAATNGLLASVRKSAKDIHDKYIAPPKTTDFAIMFLPTEGLYAEVLRQPGLHDQLQSQYRVLVAGPTSLAAILNSLRIGFQTLAIEKRSSEVWHVLSAVKTEFGKFGGVLEKVKKQLNAAANTIDSAEIRTRAMERKLRPVGELPVKEAKELLSLPESDDFDDASVVQESEGAPALES